MVDEVEGTIAGDALSRAADGELISGDKRLKGKSVNADFSAEFFNIAVFNIKIRTSKRNFGPSTLCVTFCSSILVAQHIDSYEVSDNILEQQV